MPALRGGSAGLVPDDLNPVRAKLVERAKGWRWSNARYHLRRTDKDPLIRDRTLLGLVPDARGWRELLAEEDAAAEAVLRRSSRSTRPAGDREFVKRVEKLTGRELQRRRRAGRR